MLVVFKQKTAYEMRMSDWSSDVCASDHLGVRRIDAQRGAGAQSPSDQTIIGCGRPRRGHIGRKRDTAVIIVGEQEIGRAACRERVCQYVQISVVAVSLNKKRHNKHHVVLDTRATQQ